MQLCMMVMLVCCGINAQAQDPYVEDFSTTTGTENGLTGLPEGWGVIGRIGNFERRTEQGQYKNGRPGIACHGFMDHYLVTPYLYAGPMYLYIRQYSKNYASQLKMFYCTKNGDEYVIGEQIGETASMPKGTPAFTQFSFTSDHDSYIAIAFDGIIDDFMSIMGINPNVVTGITDIDSDKAPRQMYNLNGQRVSGDAKGVMIINGKKTVVK